MLTLRKEILQLAHACGQVHPSLVFPSQFEVLDEGFQAQPAEQVFHTPDEVSLPSAEDCEAIRKIMASPAQWADEHSIYAAQPSS